MCFTPQGLIWMLGSSKGILLYGTKQQYGADVVVCDVQAQALTASNLTCSYASENLKVAPRSQSVT